jgi:hypothetical protein
MRNFTVTAVTDKSILTASMTPVTAEVKAKGGIEGSGNVIVVEHTTDNNLAKFRFRHANVAMQAAQEDFELGGKKFRAGAFIIGAGDRSAIDASLKELGLSAWATATAPTVKTHELDVPRIGYVHSWQRTQDEGWVRAALDTYGIPYTYFADIKLRDGNLRQKYDVIIYPHVGGTAISQVNGIAKNSATPLPYRKSDATPNLGVNDQADDIRGGMGIEGLTELAKFVQSGGTLLVEGSTTTIFPEYGLTTGVTVEEPQGLFARGSIMRGIISDRRSPIAYGYDGTQLPVYFNSAPVLNAGGGGGIPAEFAGFAGGAGGPSQNITPMATRLRLSPWDSTASARQPAAPGEQSQAEQFRNMARQFGINVDEGRPRVIMQFPQNPNDMLLSGTLQNGNLLSGRAQVVDATVGQGHVVMFAIRPFWRWQTHGTFFLGFNTILNWNDLGVGRDRTGTPASLQDR